MPVPVSLTLRTTPFLASVVSIVTFPPSGVWRMAFSTVNDALGAQPDAQLAAAAPVPVLAAVSYGRPPATNSSG